MNLQRRRAAETDRGETDRKESEERLRTLKRDIALNQYAVDAGAVADAIVSKLRLVRRGQMALGFGADRSPKAGERARRDH